MRRPLFVAALCVVACVAVWLLLKEEAASAQEAQELCLTAADGSVMALTDKCPVTVIGRVCQKDTQSFTLHSVLFYSKNLTKSAADQQQSFPFMQEIQCEYEAPQVRLGSVVKVSGSFRVISSATNPGEFDARSYYRARGIGGKLQKVQILSSGDAYSLLEEALYQLRLVFHDRLYQVFPDKEASVMSTILLGEREGLDPEVKSLYQKSGIAHILSISGLHITLLGMGLYRLLRRLGMPVWMAALLGAMTLLGYGVMVGMSVSACRAIGMYLLRMLAELAGRTYDGKTALGVMAAVLVIRNPYYLQDAGFLLSFGAVLGILLLEPVFARKEGVQKCADRISAAGVLAYGIRAVGLCTDGIRKGIQASLSVTLFTLPIQLWFYYEFPTYSIVLNLLVLPFMSLVMTAGLLAMLFPGLGILGTIDCVILWGYEGLCHWTETLPFHTWTVGRPQVWQIICYYTGLLLFVWFWNPKAGLAEGFAGKVRAPLVLAMLLLLLTAKPFRETTITFLDVGQGDGIFLETSQAVCLFDCGSTSRSKIGQYVLKPYLKYRGIQRIDAVFVSHPDADHMNGILELLQNSEQWGIKVDRLVLPGIAPSRRQEALGELLAAAENTDLEICYGKAGDCWQLGDLRLTCLNPPRDAEIKDSNAYSQCFYGEFEDNGMSLLFTGDVEGEGEELLIQELTQRQMQGVTLLKVAHHGSGYSTSAELLEQLHPKLSIISCGQNNSYGHPHKETLQRLQDIGTVIYRTDQRGAILVTVNKDGDSVKLKGFVKGE